MKRPIRFTGTIVLLSALLTACVPAPKRVILPAHPGNPIKTVAVLPMANNTNFVDAPAYVREELAKRIMGLHYAVQPTEQTDQILRDRVGVTLGAQLNMTTPQQLGEALGAQGVVYGVLEDFNTKHAVMMKEKKVRARFAFIKTADGTRIWGKGIGAIIVYTAGQTVVGDVMAGSSLVQAAKESEEEKARAGGETAQSLPGGLGEIPAPWVALPPRPMLGTKGEEKGFTELAVSGALNATVGRVVEKAFGFEYAEEVNLMLDRVLTGSPPRFPTGPGR